MKKLLSPFVVSLFLSLLPSFGRGAAVLVPFGASMYLPFSFSKNSVTFIPSRELNPGIFLQIIEKEKPDVLVLSLLTGMNLIKSGKLKDYVLSYVILWRSGTLVSPVSNPSFSKILVGDINNMRILKLYRKSIGENFKIVKLDFIKIFKLIVTGYKGSFVEVEPFTSFIFSLYPGRFIPFLDMATFAASYLKLRFPVDGIPLAGIFVNRTSKDARELTKLLAKRAKVLNSSPGKFSPLISENITRFFKMKFPPSVISDSLSSRRVFFYPVKFSKISGKIKKFLELFQQ